jgi:DNA-binding transcriptional regulator YdaS (Cro superfamily)
MRLAQKPARGPLPSSGTRASAIRRAGTQTALARELRISKQAVQLWRTAPVKHVLKIERLTGVSRHNLRPDIYPRE